MIFLVYPSEHLFEELTIFASEKTTQWTFPPSMIELTKQFLEWQNNKQVTDDDVEDDERKVRTISQLAISIRRAKMECSSRKWEYIDKQLKQQFNQLASSVCAWKFIVSELASYYLTSTYWRHIDI